MSLNSLTLALLIAIGASTTKLSHKDDETLESAALTAHL